MPITEEQADGEIYAFYKEFPGLSGLKISHRPTQESFYGNKASIEAVGTIKGAFLPKRGEVHLPLANFRDVGDLRKSLQHEALGHYGTLTFTGSEKRDLLKVIIAARQSPSLQDEWAKVDKAYAGQTELMKAEEVFCLAAERINGPLTKTADQVERTWSDVVKNKAARLSAKTCKPSLMPSRTASDAAPTARTFMSVFITGVRMDMTVFGFEWAEFIAALKQGTVSRPFLVRETEVNEKPEWFLYAVSSRTLVQVLTFKRKRRSWRTVDGAIRDLERDLGELPPILIHGSVDTVDVSLYVNGT